MKKIFIALLLSAACVCTWAQKEVSFGVNKTSTWKTTSNPKALLINIDVADDLQKAGIGWSANCDINDGRQNDVTITGKISLSDFVNVINGSAKDLFVYAKSLNMSEAEFVGNATDFEQAKSDFSELWNKAGNSWAHSENGVVVGKLYYPGDVVIKQTAHVTPSSSFEPNDVCDIHRCGDACTHILKDILSEAGITNKARLDLVRIHLDNKTHKVTGALANINTFALDLSEVTNLDSWADVKNQYVGNVILPPTVGDFNNAIADNFNKSKLYNVIAYQKCTAEDCEEILMNAYINKPGFFATGLQYVPTLEPTLKLNTSETQWYNVNIENHKGKGYEYDTKNLTKLKLSGYVFARDIKNTSEANVDADGHLIRCGVLSYQNDPVHYQPGFCYGELAPSRNDPNVHYCPEGAQGYAHMTFNSKSQRGAQVTNFDFRDAQFGYVDASGVFQYYPADMTLSQLQVFDSWRSVAEVKLPTSSTQYIIPTAFLDRSKYVREICIPCNYTEFHKFAFLGEGIDTLRTSDGTIYGYKGGITHYTTTVSADDELEGIFNGLVHKGDTIDYGDRSLTLPSTTKFVAHGAFTGYDGAALIEDVYVLAKEAPFCEFFAFDQKTYVGDNYHHKGHLIKKGNYVDVNMAMLHFPNTTDRIEMLNYSDMTRHYRLYDETGHYDNVGNILVWPTQAQYNRSFNQALAGVTWWAWKENLEYEKDKNGNIIYEYQIDEKGDTLKDVNGNPLYKYLTDDNGNIVWDENGNPKKIAKYKDDPENAYSAGAVAGGGYENANHEYLFTKAAADDGYSSVFIEQYQKNPHNFFDGTESKGSVNSDLAEWDTEMLAKSIATTQTDRPLTYDWIKYGGWHQFVISELYDFMLDDPNPDPDVPKPDYFNFAKYNKNVWYAVCFPFNLTKAQFRKAFGDPENNKDPYLSTLAGVTRNADQLKITVHMSNNLLENKIVYDENCPNTVKCDASTGFKEEYEPVEYGEDDIVVEANKPYFVLPCLPKEELIKAATGYRRSEITTVKTDGTDDIKNVQFPIPLHVHAVNGTNTAFATGVDSEATDTTYAYNYYFVGNYIPQTMPMYAYYVGLTKKSNGDWWSSFFRMTPGKNKTWEANSAIVMAISNVEDETNPNQAKSKGFLGSEESITSNLVWKAQPHNDWVFFEGTGKEAYTKSAFGMQVDSSNFTTSIQLPEDFKPAEDSKVYNLNGQYVGTTFGNFAKGIYIVGGKKVVVK